MALKNAQARVLTFAVSGALLVAGCDGKKGEKEPDGTANPGPKDSGDDGAKPEPEPPVNPGPMDEGEADPPAPEPEVDDAGDAGEVGNPVDVRTNVGREPEPKPEPEPPIKTNPGPATK